MAYDKPKVTIDLDEYNELKKYQYTDMDLKNVWDISEANNNHRNQMSPIDFTKPSFENFIMQYKKG